MNRTQSIYLKRCKSICNTKLLEHESIVQSGLAVTPNQMIRMTEKGIAIAPQNLSESMFSDTDNTKFNDFNVPLEECRYSDINTLWETRQEIKKKFRNVRKEVKDATINPTPES